MKQKAVWLFFCIVCFSCHKPVFKERWIKEKAPEQFSVSFETSKGFFEAEFQRSWSPKAVDRIYEQVKHGYYNRALFYRVVPKFVAQFGNDDSVKMQKWKKYKIPDEPVIKTNERGTISFARDGKESRDNDLYINLKDNPKLDTINYNGVKGFPAVGRITKNMSVVDSLYSGYGDRVFKKYDTLFIDKTAFLKIFPKLDSIQHASLIKTKK